MEPLTVFVPLFVLLLFAGMVIFSIMTTRRAKEAKTQMVQTLGMTPVLQPGSALLEQIAGLYRTGWATAKYELRNVSRRILSDGELFLFDLVDTSGDGDSTTERSGPSSGRKIVNGNRSFIAGGRSALGSLRLRRVFEIVAQSTEKLSILAEFLGFFHCSEHPNDGANYFGQAMARCGFKWLRHVP